MNCSFCKLRRVWLPLWVTSALEQYSHLDIHIESLDIFAGHCHQPLGGEGVGRAVQPLQHPTQLTAQLLAASPLKLRRCVGRAEKWPTAYEKLTKRMEKEDIFCLSLLYFFKYILVAFWRKLVDLPALSYTLVLHKHLKNVFIAL